MSDKINLEIITRGQHLNPLWHQERQYRLTASNFGMICRLRETTDRLTVAKRMYRTGFTGNRATRYGQNNGSHSNSCI